MNGKHLLGFALVVVLATAVGPLGRTVAQEKGGASAALLGKEVMLDLVPAAQKGDDSIGEISGPVQAVDSVGMTMSVKKASSASGKDVNKALLGDYFIPWASVQQLRITKK